MLQGRVSPKIHRRTAGAREAPKVSLLQRSRDSLAYTRRTLALVWRSSRAMTIALGTLTLTGAVAPLGVAYAGKRIVDAVVARSGEETLRWVLAELGLVVLLAATSRGLGLVRSLLGARLGIDINVGILEKALDLELKWFEDADFYDKLSRARREASSRPVALVTESFQLVQNLITLVGYAALLLQFSAWAVAALLLATVPATIAEMRYSKLAFRVRNWRSPDSRRLLYLEIVLASDEHAKEVKLFGLGPLLLGRYKDLSETFYDEDRRLAVRRAGATHALSLLATGTFYAAYASMALLAAKGSLSLGNMTMYILAFRQGQQAFQSLLGGIGNMYEHNLYMSNLFSYLETGTPVLRLLPASDAKTSTPAVLGISTERPGVSGVSPDRKEGIWFEGVGFKYDGKEVWVLRGIDLHVKSGESLALVGQNGAGKTTLIKLLARLYDPTEGRIFLDGRDLREWDRDGLFSRLGVVFQDFNQYQLRVRENVGFGSVAHLDDDARMARAVERGGAAELVSGLKGGLEAPLGRWFNEGNELSGGQWQKIALARAFMREEADILILDEPTAALDAEAEHAVFARFRELSRGRTTIVISHRFPTVRMAQRIVVLDEGKILETGSHEELVAAGGKYARMFALQAEGYR
jgi:ATP-binding cassette subfamily B protein